MGAAVMRIEASLDGRSRPALASGPLIFVGGLWLASALVSEAPLGGSLLVKGAALLLPLAVTSLIALVRPVDGLALWGIGLTFLVVQTGFQFDVGRVRFSVLEGVIVLLCLLLAWHKRRSPALRCLSLRLPGRTAWLLFAAYGLLLLVIGQLRGASLDLAIFQFKGFVLYPLMIVVLVAAWQQPRLLRLSAGLLLAVYALVAARGLAQFWQAGSLSPLGVVTRASGDYGPINVYGLTLMAGSLLALGLALGSRSAGVRALAWLAAAWLFAGSAVSVSRTVWLCYCLGLVRLWLSGPRRRWGLVLVVLLMGVLLWSLPSETSARLLQLSDSSFVRRQSYLASGLYAAAAGLLFGLGWGRGYWFSSLGGLVPTGWIPWYHNDYLNLWVQAGVLGLALYMAFWGRLLLASRWSEPQAGTDADLAGLELGSQAAVVALLAAAMFEHVLWRPDSAGLVAWMAGLMLASGRRRAKEQAGP